MAGLWQEGEGSSSEGNPPPGLIGWFARAAIVVVSSARLDSLVGCRAVQALWLIFIFSAVPPWLRALFIRSRPPSLCRGNGRLATTRRWEDSY